MAKSTRPSPTESATWYMPGTYKIGNDGYYYTIAINSAGIHRWVKARGTFSIHEVKSINHPRYNLSMSFAAANQPITMNYKFEIGDIVKVVFTGSGCGPKYLNDIVTIIDRGVYGTNPGYKVHPAIGNTLSGDYKGFIGEETFELVSKPVRDSIKTNPIKIKNMAKTKTITKRSTAERRTINTSLINKEEVFKMLALAEATGLPLLLVGDPGVAKTKTIIEYAKAWLNKDGQMTNDDFTKKLYILETDEGTKASEIKGMPDLQTLFTQNKFELSTPIADAEIVIINEVDKASSAIRNAMLGVMNEKFLFNGKHKVPCKWKLFVATCNEIPKDEKNSPFWDRFMLKMEVNRVSAGDMIKYYSKGGRSFKETFVLGIPNKAEIDSVEISPKKLEKYLEVGYNSSSDRTLTFVPLLAKAISYIWDTSVDGALIKTASIMIGASQGSELKSKLISPEMKNVMSKVEMLHSYNTNEQLELAVADIESLINTYATRGTLNEDQVGEIENTLSYALSIHPARKDYASVDEFETLANEYEVDHNPSV